MHRHLSAARSARSRYLEQRGRVLLERRSDSRRWGFVGGKVDDDESVEAALRREVREETGLELDQLDFFGIFSDPTRIIAYGMGTSSGC